MRSVLKQNRKLLKYFSPFLLTKKKLMNYHKNIRYYICLLLHWRKTEHHRTTCRSSPLNGCRIPIQTLEKNKGMKVREASEDELQWRVFGIVYLTLEKLMIMMMMMITEQILDSRLRILHTSWRHRTWHNFSEYSTTPVIDGFCCQILQLMFLIVDLSSHVHTMSIQSYSLCLQYLHYVFSFQYFFYFAIHHPSVFSYFSWNRSYS